MSDDEIGLALIRQVSKAMPRNGTEQNVTTFITRPMWCAWCRFVKMPENSKPTEWLGIPATMRVYGSEAIVVESIHNPNFKHIEFDVFKREAGLNAFVLTPTDEMAAVSLTEAR